MRSLATFAIATVLLSGCAGAVSSVPATPSGGGSKQAAKVAVTLHVRIPHSRAASGGRRSRYVSPATAGIEVIDTTASGQTTNAAPCAASECAIVIPSVLGQNTFAVALFDSRGQLLSAGSASKNIVAGTSNDVFVTFDPVVAGVHLPFLSAAPGRAQAITAAPILHDGDGYTLVGSEQLLDARGNPTTIVVQDSDPSGHSSIGNGRITKANGTFTLNYNGGSSTFASLTAKAATAVVTAGSFVSASITNTYPITKSGTGVYALSAGPGAAVWMVAGLAIPNAEIVSVQSNGQQKGYTFSTGIPDEQLTAGPDGNMWFSDEGSEQIGKVTPSGQITIYPLKIGARPQGLSPGSDGNVWFANGKSVGRIAPDGTTKYFSLSVNASVVALGSDGRIYVNGEKDGTLTRIAPDGTKDRVRLPLHGYAAIVDVVAGPNGAIWYDAFDASGNTYVGWVQPSGKGKIYPLTGASVYVRLIAATSNVVWLTDTSVGLRWILPTGAQGAVSLPDLVAGSGGITAISPGSDGALWLGVYNINKVFRMTF